MLKTLAAVLLFILPASAGTTATNKGGENSPNIATSVEYFLCDEPPTIKPVGTFTANLTTTWNGNTRYYDQYIPATLPANPLLWIMFHGTTMGTTQPTAFDRQAMQALAVANGMIVIWPKSTFHASTNSWYWDAFFLDYDFSPDPDDSGFVRSLILQFQGQPYYVGNTFAVGMSSGGFMAWRVGVDSSDLVTAIGAAEAQLYSENSLNTIPGVVRPFSAILFNGDADLRVGYCGQKANWGDSSSPASDVTLEFAAQEIGYIGTLPQLCTNGQPTVGVEGALLQMPGVTVQFIRRDGGGHNWDAGTEATMLTFFLANLR